MKSFTESGGPAFPVLAHPSELVESYGMTLRDYFAAKAMQAMVAHLNSEDRRRYADGLAVGREAQTAYAIADAMLAEREK